MSDVWHAQETDKASTDADEAGIDAVCAEVGEDAEERDVMAVYRCVQPFAYVNVEGTPVSVGAGEVMWSEDPEFRKRAAFFEPIEPLEDATAEPGRFRSLTPRRRGRPPKDRLEAVTAEPEPVPDIVVPEPESEPVKPVSKPRSHHG